MCKPFVWSHLGLNQGLPDYESGALTNGAIGPVQSVALKSGAILRFIIEICKC